MEIKDQCSVIVSSWDGFADCWPFFVHGLKKYWPDCPWRVLLMTTGSLPQFEGIETVNLREDRGWASNLKRTLEHVSTPYVLYLQEDYWIEKQVDTAALANVLAEMRKQNAGYARIVPVPPPDQKTDAATGLGACSADNRYRVCLQAAFWKKDFLENCSLRAKADGILNTKAANAPPPSPNRASPPSATFSPTAPEQPSARDAGQ